jgi:hypothetical protein
MGQEFSNQYEQGFAALISVIIIAAVLMAVTFSLSANAFFLRFNVLDAESKKISLALAESCLQTAMLDLAKGSLTVPQIVNVGSLTCKICDKSGANPITLKTRAVYGNSFSNLTVVLLQNGGRFSVNSWDESENYSGPACVL